jgi:hypothetical protein
MKRSVSSQKVADKEGTTTVAKISKLIKGKLVFQFQLTAPRGPHHKSMEHIIIQKANLIIHGIPETQSKEKGEVGSVL